LRHEKLLVDGAAVGHDAHADWYRFGSDNGAERPLVAYFGGSISSAVYHARRESEPTSLVELFEAAREHVKVESVDLLVVPCPLIGRAVEDFRARIFRFVLEEILPGTPNPKPAAMSLFGNSAGAHIAAMLAFELDTVRALVTTAGVGMAEAAAESERRLFAGKRYLSFANREDFCASYSHEFSRMMSGLGITVEVIEREGGHAFADYVANGSARHAFAFALEGVAHPLRSAAERHE
jgi:hypothetical protein